MSSEAAVFAAGTVNADFVFGLAPKARTAT
jgi:hypothetical protein